MCQYGRSEQMLSLIHILNMRHFNLRYVILKDGVPVAEEEFGLPDGKPGEHRTIHIPYLRHLTEDADYHINLCLLYTSRYW